MSDILNYAIVNNSNNIVENIFIWDGEDTWSPPDGCTALLLGEGGASIGWSYDAPTQTWTAPPEPEVIPAPTVL